MALTKCKLGEWLELREVCNEDLAYDVDRVRGVNNAKKLMPTKSDLAGRDLSKFQIVSPGDFVFNHRTSRNGEKFSIAYNDTAEDVICTEDYVVFRVSEKGRGKIVPEWLYMYFNRPEFDRYVITNSWGSSTEFFNWEDLCAVEIDFPPVSVQSKYVAVYNAMKANVESYEHGLDDLKLSCDAVVEELRRKKKSECIGKYLCLGEERNGSRFTLEDVRGISIKKEFIPTKADMDGVSLRSYLVVRPDAFAYVPVTSRNGGKITLALNDDPKPHIVSSAYVSFSTDHAKLQAGYLMAYFMRNEFDRYARFNSWGSARETFAWEDMREVEIPIVNLEVQKSVAGLLSTYRKRKVILERLKSQIAGLCPVLIKGSLDEGKRK